MNIQMPRAAAHEPWEQVRQRLDQNAPFSNMYETPYYRDAVYDHFSKQEYQRRYRALRDKMREHNLDCVIVPGGPSHWSFGGGMQWLTGHWEWHAVASYVVVPLEAEPTLIFSMGGTHAEACRRECANALSDVRHSRGGKYADVIVERLKELKLERGRIGLLEIDARHNDYLPVNQYNVLRQSLPEAELIFTKGFMHELVVVHSEEELRCVRKAGVLCERAMQAILARAKPGVPEYELRAAAGAAILDGGGDIDFLIIGSTPMADPAMVVGNPRPSHRKLKNGDIINMELAAGYNGLSAQIGSPITVGPPTDMVRKFWDEIALPGYRKIVAEIKPGNATDNMRLASRFFRECGVQSRPTQVHGIDIVTDKPHVFAERTEADEIDKVLKPRMIIMAEPNPITADGMFGIFLGHTLIDGDQGMGHVVMTYAANLAVELARAAGVGWVGARCSNHAGAGAIYAAIPLRHGMVGIYIAASSVNHMAPWGGSEPLLGTNPIAVAIPAGDEPPVVLDIATSLASNGAIRTYELEGKPMPAGWVQHRKDGSPVTDPRRIEEGTYLPMGGYKGSGLSLVIGLLAGPLNRAAFGRDIRDFAAPASEKGNVGQFVVAFDVARFVLLDAFKAEVDRHIRDLISSHRLPGRDEIRVPGMGRAARRAERERNGVPLSASVLAQIDELAKSLDVATLSARA